MEERLGAASGGYQGEGMNNESIFQNAINRWGETLQLDVLVEECAELIRAVQKYKRKVATGWLILEARGNVAEEAADVLIMIEQLKIMKLGAKDSMEAEIEKWHANKIERLEGRLE